MAASGDLSPTPAGMHLGRRRLANRVVWIVCGLAMVLIVIPVASILEGVVRNGLAHWHWRLLTRTTVGQAGGLANAIAGTFVIVVGVALVAGIVGVAGGLYLAEYAPPRWVPLLRGGSEVLSGVPSIVLGYVGYITLVVAFHWGFSLGAALVVLSVLVIPYIVKSTEVAIRNVPTAYREGGEGLGLGSAYALRRLVLKPALPGIATGMIVGIAIALGETAPLLYTAGWSDHLPTHQLTHAAIGYLPYVVYVFYNQPYASSRQLSNLAALVLIFLVLVMIVAARVIVSFTQRYAPDRPSRGRSR